jgi:hypothetical protein
VKIFFAVLAGLAAAGVIALIASHH